MTTIATQQDVLLALLALDAYSRGENAQHRVQVGNHTFEAHAPRPPRLVPNAVLELG